MAAVRAPEARIAAATLGLALGWTAPAAGALGLAPGWTAPAAGAPSSALLAAAPPGNTPSATAQHASAGAAMAFDAEVIRLTVRGDTLVVTGLYRLCRRKAGAAPGAPSLHAPRAPCEIFYPFPADPRMGAVRPGDVECRAPGGDWRPVPHTPLPHGAGLACRLAWPPTDSLDVRVTYRHALTEAYARYLVTTTRAWGEPLRAARFEICLPPGAELIAASYPFTLQDATSGEECDGRRYRYATTDFWPERDIVFEWARARDPARTVPAHTPSASGNRTRSLPE